MCPYEKFWSVWGTTGVVIKFIFKNLIEKYWKTMPKSKAVYINAPLCQIPFDLENIRFWQEIWQNNLNEKMKKDKCSNRNQHITMHPCAKPSSFCHDICPKILTRKNVENINTKSIIGVKKCMFVLMFKHTLGPN